MLSPYLLKEVLAGDDRFLLSITVLYLSVSARVWCEYISKCWGVCRVRCVVCVQACGVRAADELIAPWGVPLRPAPISGRRVRARVWRVCRRVAYMHTCGVRARVWRTCTCVGVRARVWRDDAWQGRGTRWDVYQQ